MRIIAILVLIIFGFSRSANAGIFDAIICAIDGVTDKAYSSQCGWTPSANQQQFINYRNSSVGANQGTYSITQTGYKLVYDGLYGTSKEGGCALSGGTLDSTSTPHSCAWPSTTKTAAILGNVWPVPYTYDCATGNKVLGISSNECYATSSDPSNCLAHGGEYLGLVGTSNMCKAP